VRSTAERVLIPVAASNGQAAQREPGRPIPVLRPKLPSAQALLPYLERIDASRTYSNWGPLVSELSERLAHKLGAPAGGLVCANSGMAALIGAILAAAGRATRERPLAIVPDYTFTATALAAQMCGYELVLASCAAEGWAFTPGDLAARPGGLDRVGLVLPVAPFGRLIAQAPWQAFQDETGIPVVIDAAASFDLLPGHAGIALGPVAVALSFHATKCFGVGEGGCVITTDASLSLNVLRCLNFGFLESRNTAMPGTNGKMPEYTAAVGLAELDAWDRKHEDFLQVGRAYQAGLKHLEPAIRLWGPPDISCGYVILGCRDAQQAAAVVAALAADAIDTRLWYGTGLHDHDAFGQAQRWDLHGPAALDPRVLVGLPTAVDMGADDIRRVCAAIGSAVA
jgi:dTDP-4-amino-4,6-dideoxygalactose transaminase